MAEEPDRLKEDIEGTRRSLTRDVDRLADRTSPKRVAQRSWTSVKETVMGSSEHAARHASSMKENIQDRASQLSGAAEGKAHDVVDTVRDAPRAVGRQAQGSPLAAGIIAFGAGLLAAALIPVSDAERRAGQQLKENTGDLTDRMKDMAGEMKDEMAGSVRNAMENVKETATDAAHATKDAARSSAQDAADETRAAARH
jgi:uncharacterized protein YjbJ (UPF0337 family)